MKRAFSLMEVILALAILAIMVVALLPNLGHLGIQVRQMGQEEAISRQAQALMEEALAYRDPQAAENFTLVISPYGDGLDLVEVYYEGEKVLEALRPQASLYSP